MNINDLFDITVDGKIALTPAALATPVFRKVYEGIEDKSTATKEIEYIIFKHHWKTPYHVYGNPNSREAYVKRGVFNDENYEIHEVTKESEKEYAEELQTSELIKMLTSARIGIWYITESFESLKTSKDTNPLEVIKWTKELGQIAKSLDTIEKAIKADELEKGRVRGGNEIQQYELPKTGLQQQMLR